MDSHKWEEGECDGESLREKVERRDAGEKRMESGIPKAAGTGRNISLYFAIEMGQRGENHYGKEWK